MHEHTPLTTAAPPLVLLSPHQKRLTDELSELLRSDRKRAAVNFEAEQPCRALPGVPLAAQKILANQSNFIVINISPLRANPDAFVFSEVPVEYRYAVKPTKSHTPHNTTTKTHNVDGRPSVALSKHHQPKDNAVCHICGKKFSDMNVHLASDSHRKRVQHPDTWNEIDQLMREFHCQL